MYLKVEKMIPKVVVVVFVVVVVVDVVVVIIHALHDFGHILFTNIME